MLEHEYTVLGGINRARIGHYLGIVSGVVSAGVVFLLLSAVDVAKTFGIAANLPPSVMSLVSAGAVFVVLYWLLEKYAWKWWPLASVLKGPNLAGDWSVQGQTVKPDGTDGYQWTAKITIVQSWDRIRVRLKTAQSGSNSTSAALIYDPADGFRLFYSYKNDPNINEVELKSHRGSADITFAKDLKSANGEYFNGHGRYTFGKMALTRI
ncbi:membrane protein [Mesorhizobium sp. LNHC221B00]|uniref:Cap15 family cyclic dinucleotide receptor domain-containing protein n=1 Tax=Mesorhizobium sp. LNHC221B00 TaxID=1287233 RepID=UPI0003CED39E|nr:hypothetical protein [Mesorhizobium sp. LNHC221B00]ESY79268.1 membrane protein [Mesorhizobium sp. LNHC221B00]